MNTLKIKLNATPTILHPGANIEALNKRIRCHVEITDIPENVDASAVLRIVKNALFFNPPSRVSFRDLTEKTKNGLLITQ